MQYKLLTFNKKKKKGASHVRAQRLVYTYKGCTQYTNLTLLLGLGEIMINKKVCIIEYPIKNLQISITINMTGTISKHNNIFLILYLKVNINL